MLLIYGSVNSYPFPAAHFLTFPPFGAHTALVYFPHPFQSFPMQLQPLSQLFPFSTGIFSCQLLFEICFGSHPLLFQFACFGALL